MNQLYAHLKAFSTLILVVWSSVITAENIKLKENTPNSIQLKENSYQRIVLLNTFAEFNTLKIQTEAGLFTGFAVSGYSNTDIPGQPRLPVNRRLIEIPMDATPVVKVISYKVEEYSLSELGIDYPIIPSQPPCPKCSVTPPPFEYNASIYNQDHFWGIELVTVDVLGILKGIRIGRINIAPVSYNPVTQTIRIFNDMVIEVRFENANITKTEQLKQLNDNPYFRGISASLLNYKQPALRDTITKSPVKMVIVSDPMFQSQLEPFVAWKTRKGFTVVEAYTDDPQVGTTKESIRAYLQSIYDAGTPEDPAPTFVLFVGDVAQIPAWELNGESDRLYCEYTNDLFPEIFYGRFSAQNPAQLQPQIDKTLQYEQFTMPDPSFLGEVVMIGGMDGNYGANWANGQINYGTENYFNEAHGILSHTYLYPQSGSQSAQIIQRISDGVAFANYTAHGSPSGWADPSFSTGDIPSLQNQDQYGLLIGNACSTNEFAVSECFGEALLRAANKGALGYIGGSNSTYWDEDYYWGVGVGPISQDPPSYEETTLGAYDRMFHDHGEPVADWYTTQDQMIFAGNLAVTEGAPGSAEYYWDIYCLMGDPSLTLYLGVPSSMTVTYDQLMPLASESFSVTAEPYAYVAISKDGILCGAAFADESGTADVSLIPITIPGEAEIIVTCQNRQPFTGSVTVASPEGPYVLFKSLEMDDTYGNNNQQADFGETIALNITLENVGNSAASNLVATLSSQDLFVTISDNEHTWPLIESDSSSTQMGAFTVAVHDSIPDNHKTTFTLSITDGNEVWTSQFSFQIFAPVLEIKSFSISDVLYGNGNGRLDAGEIVDLLVSCTNSGHCGAGAATLNLSSSNNFIILNSSFYQIEEMPIGETQQAVFNVTVDPSAPLGNVASFDFTLASGSYLVTRTIDQKIGSIIEDFETASFESFDWQFDGYSEWTIWETGYSGSYSARSGSIPNAESTTLKITIDVLADDTISFFRKVSSEDGYDFLSFYIDETLKGQWSGNQNWEQVSFPVTQGQHTFRWVYEKDYYVISGSDCSWIDFIEFPAMEVDAGPLSLTAHAMPQEICLGATTMLFAIPSGGTGQYTYMWEPGTSLSNPVIFNPWAYPDQTTLYTVSVSDGQDTVSAEVSVTILPLPEPPVISQIDEILVSSVAEGNQWYLWGQPIPEATGQTYIPETTGEYSARVIGENGCYSNYSNTIYYLYISVDELVNKQILTIYPNPFRDLVRLDFSLDKAASVSMVIFNSLGEKVRTLLDGTGLSAGTYSIDLYSADLQPGIYYCRFESDNLVEVRKLILTK
jgi:hypothetical protein